MTVENADFPTQLVPEEPLGVRPKSEGDDHLRVIKKVIKTTFSNLDGPVNFTPTQANRLVSISGTSVLGRAGTGAAEPVAIQASTNDQILRRTGNTLQFGQLTSGMFPPNVVPNAAISDDALGSGTADADSILAGNRSWAKLSSGMFPNDVVPNAAISDAALGSETPNSATFLRGDRKWSSVVNGKLDAQEFRSGFTSLIGAHFWARRSDASLDEKIWSLNIDSVGAYFLGTRNDDESFGQVAYKILRTGNVVNRHEFRNNNIQKILIKDSETLFLHDVRTTDDLTVEGDINGGGALVHLPTPNELFLMSNPTLDTWINVDTQVPAGSKAVWIRWSMQNGTLTGQPFVLLYVRGGDDSAFEGRQRIIRIPAATQSEMRTADTLLGLDASQQVSYRVEASSAPSEISTFRAVVLGYTK